ncbi:MAG: GNAT family N-acetyltransferase, partial [Oscillospiraceae bacterium]
MSTIQYDKATAADREEIIKFANFVFTSADEKIDFESRYPHLYSKEVNRTEHHYVARENGKIIAMLGAFPFEISMLGEAYPAYGIGTVATHPQYTGQGHMRTLLALALEDIRKSGAVFCVLHGLRKRYEHFGFSVCGTSLSYTVTADGLKSLSAGALPLISLVDVPSEDSRFVAAAQRLCQRQPFYFKRSDADFIDICRSVYSQLYAIQQGNSFEGYAVCNSDGSVISELLLKDAHCVYEALNAHLKRFSINSVRVALPPFALEEAALLERICQNVEISQTANFNIFDYEIVLLSLLKLKKSIAPLCNGKLVLEILNVGTFCI